MTVETEDQELDMKPGELPQPVRVRVGLSWTSLAAEHFWPILWPAGAVVGAFLILALSNAFASMPEWLHLTVLVGLVGAFIASILWSVSKTSVPTRSEALRHLERSSGLVHRPLTALEDHPAVGDTDDTGLLWRAHRRQIMRSIRNLKVSWPKLSLHEHDPHAFRVLMVLVILALTVANASDVPRRLFAAVSPGFAQGRAAASFEAWVTPPTYTGQPPRHLTAAAGLGSADQTFIDVPDGSELTIRTHGDATAVIRLGALGHSVPDPQRPEFLPAGGDARDAKLKLNKDMTVRLSLSAAPVAQWKFRTIPDNKPEIAFKTPLAVTQSQSLRFNYQVKDDYGVSTANASVALETDPNAKPLPPITFELPLPPAPARQGEATVFKDLTAHVWSGLPVIVTLAAKDERGQTATSKPLRIQLPERRFNEPLARALIEQRKSLSRDPSSAPVVAKALDALSIAPERFMPDTRSYLALRTAYYLVARAKTPGEVASAQQLLWDLALRVEEGDTPQAQAELRAIQQQLMEALARGAPEEEIARLLAQLRSAIERTMKAMAEKAQGQPQTPSNPNVHALRPEDVQTMLDAIQNLSQQGSRAAAQQMLTELQNMLENMQAMGGAKMTPEQQAATDAIDKLGNMIGQQRGLMDKTFRANDQSEGAPPPSNNQQLSNEQRALGQQLSTLMKQLGPNSQTPEALSDAQKSMARAAEDLAQGRLGAAGESQKQAIDQLRRGGEAVARQLLQQMARQGGSMPGDGPGQGEDEDPFGRPQASYGPSFGESVRVPEKLDIQKAREILEELQRRAAERGRPPYELDYLDRLLRRF